MSFQISVIIPSFNGALRISRLLHALEIQDRKDFETIVVLDGSTDNSREILNENNWGLNLRVINQKNKGRSGARNAGAAEALGEYLIFYDDDVEPDPDSISLHIEALNTGEISVGQQLELLNSTSEFGKYKAVISRRWVADLGNTPVILNSKNIFLTAANMAIKAEAFNQINGFDSVLKDAEDFDLAVRAFIKGYNIVFTPQNQAIHYAFDSCKSYILRQREYRKAHYILISLREDNQLYQKYQVKKSSIKKIIYFFIPGVSVMAVDRGLFSFLPVKCRYKIYARIISALSVYYPHRKLY